MTSAPNFFRRDANSADCSRARVIKILVPVRGVFSLFEIIQFRQLLYVVSIRFFGNAEEGLKGVQIEFICPVLMVLFEKGEGFMEDLIDDG